MTNEKPQPEPALEPAGLERPTIDGDFVASRGPYHELRHPLVTGIPLAERGPPPAAVVAVIDEEGDDYRIKCWLRRPGADGPVIINVCGVAMEFRHTRGALWQALPGADAVRSAVSGPGGAGTAEAFEDPPEAVEAVALTLAPHPSQSAIALHDIVRGAYAFHLWSRLGWQDIRKRYRRSKLGPFWLTISMGLLVTTLATLYGALFKIETADYVPFLTLGFIVWGLISGLAAEGCAAFTNAAHLIKGVSLPLSVYVYRVVWRNLIVFFHNIVIFVVVAVLFSIWPGWAGLLALPGLVLLCLNGVWTGMLLGIVSARFRDLPPIVASIMRITFFVTPIIWMPSQLAERAVLLDFNLFFHVLELVRAPLLGQAPSLVSWLMVSGITLGGGVVTFELFRRYRRRIAYWV